MRSRRKDLKPPEIDLSGALNNSKAPVMIDFMHTNEQGAREVAAAMFPYLRPALRRSRRTIDHEHSGH